jgi:hypothetical protein
MPSSWFLIIYVYVSFHGLLSLPLLSLCFRKDLVAMLSLVEPKGMQAYLGLYRALLQVLPAQIATMDKGFLEVSK